MSALNHPQLPLGFEPGELFTFDSFIVAGNTVAVGLAKQLAQGEGEKQLYFWGKSGLGKSHLLQACANFAAKNQRHRLLPDSNRNTGPVSRYVRRAGAGRSYLSG